MTGECEMPNEWCKASAPVSITQLTFSGKLEYLEWVPFLSWMRFPFHGFWSKEHSPVVLAGAAVTSSNCLANYSWDVHWLYLISSSSEEFLWQDLLFPLPTCHFPSEQGAKCSQTQRHKKGLAHADTFLRI